MRLERRAQPRHHRVVPSSDPGDPPENLVDVDRTGFRDLLDVGPVARAVEQRFEHHERRATEDWNRPAPEWDVAHATRYVLVERVHVEEEIERRVVPPHAHLPV